MESTKTLVSKPSVKPMAVAIETTRALWLEGMPPVLQKKVKATSRSDFERDRRMFITALRNCATNKLHTAERKTGFRTNPTPLERTPKLILASFPEGRPRVKERR